jgi:choline dehydrogenase/glucose dehydrogenase (acceptor)
MPSGLSLPLAFGMIVAYWPDNRKSGPLMVPPFIAKKHGYREGTEPSNALLED